MFEACVPSTNLKLDVTIIIEGLDGALDAKVYALLKYLFLFFLVFLL